MKYAHINENGQLLGWYDKEINTSIPTPNIEVSDEQWQIAMDNEHNKVNKDGSTEFFDFRTEAEKDHQLLEQQKAEIARQLSVLTVTSSKGNIFDADSQARQDMADAILASDTLGITQTVWRMADDSEVLIDIIELKEAHALAIQEYARIKGIGV